MIKYHSRKFISFILSIIMLFSCFQASMIVFAQTYSGELPSFNKGDIVELGSYPQSKVEDEALLSELNSLELNWTSYKYMSNNEYEDYAFYCDVQHKNEKYRAVTFTAYRPNYTSSKAYDTSTSSTQYVNGYFVNEVYWFRYEPIKWLLLNNSGSAISLNIIDAQAFAGKQYSNTGSSYVYNDPAKTQAAEKYETSYVKNWLRTEFYKLAFTDAEKNALVLSEDDRVELCAKAQLCGNGYKSEDYADTNRLATVTDYALAQGASSAGTYLLKDSSTMPGQTMHISVQGGFTRTGVSYLDGVRISVQLNISEFNKLYNFTPDYTYKTGDIIEYGYYPQTEIKDEALISELNALDLDWISYEYYTNTQDDSYGTMYPSDYMQYADVIFDTQKYRAVRFSLYRPTNAYSDVASEAETVSRQAVNGFYINNVYWFKFEPVEWTVLDPEDGLIFSKLVLDSQPFNNYYGKDDLNESGTDISRYDDSSIRKWLDNNFYNTAFVESDTSIIKESILDNNNSNMNTTDKVFLLSDTEAYNEDYGFYDSDSVYVDYSKQTIPSDYAKCQGVNARCTAMLRTASDNIRIWGINYSGHADYLPNDRCSQSDLGVRPALRIDLNKYKQEKLYERVGGYKSGDIIEFGNYPQTRIREENLLKELNKIELNWTSYGYYTNTECYANAAMYASDYMQYADTMYEGEKYRAVKFSLYRPTNAYADVASIYEGVGSQGVNGYYIDTVYWFKYEPVKWRILDPEEGLVLSELVIDSQSYNNYLNIEDPNGDSLNEYGRNVHNYPDSSIRKWLNESFYATAFDNTDVAIINESTLSYDSGNLNDKMFLLSVTEATNENYGLHGSTYNKSKEAMLQTTATDYAKCQGLSSTESSLRTDGTGSEYYYLSVFGGVSSITNQYSIRSDRGIRPAMRIDLSSYKADNLYTYLDDYMMDFIKYPQNSTAPDTIPEFNKGDVFELGSYPQSRVTDEEILNKLNSLELEWKSYNYLADNKFGDFGLYCDVCYNNEKYRAVKLIENRPGITTSSTASSSVQKNNGYDINEIYWFKYEPLKWKIIDNTGLAISENIIDAQSFSGIVYEEVGKSYIYNDPTEKEYALKYSSSHVRKWLTEEFYKSTFSDKEKNVMLTREIFVSDTSNGYTSSRSLNDVTLSSYSTYNNADYGLGTSEARVANSTDYAMSQGASPVGNYFTNSPCNNLSTVYVIDDKGSFSEGSVKTVAGVRPEIQIDLTRVNKLYYDNPNYVYDTGDIIEYGSYPQTEIKDEKLLSELNGLNLDWKSYGYYTNEQGSSAGTMYASDYMKYADVDYDGDKFRAVRFSLYRPKDTTYCATIGESISYQSNNGYYINTTYWFRYEPIKWRILDPDEGFVFSELVIDSQALNNYTYSDNPNNYSENEYGRYSNNYADSSLRKWLNESFYDDAFKDVDKTIINNSFIDNTPTVQPYGSDHTVDKLFLLSIHEASNEEYGFYDGYGTYEEGRVKQTHATDYSKCQGLETTASRLRTGINYARCSCIGPFGGTAMLSNVDATDTHYGIRPAMRMNLNEFYLQNHNHTYASEIQEATCETDGEITYTCSICGDIYCEVIPAINHKWDDGVIDPVSTCKTHGTKTYTCQNDLSHTYTEEVPFDENNHVGETYIKDNKAATCTEDGYTGDKYCSDCDALLEKGEAIPATDHDWGEWTTVTPATCEEDGLEKRVCKNDANHVEESVLPAINHKWDDGVIDPVSTCKTHGVKTYTCQNDNSHKKTEEVALDVNNHVGETYIKDDKAATCLEDGYTGDTYCSDCDALLEKGEAIPATDHDWGEWTTVTPAKCEADGLEKRVCKNDANHVEENVLPAIEHKWDNGVIDPVSTCKTHGVKTYTCQNDTSHKKTEQVALDENNHVGETYIKDDKAATCLEDGYTGDKYCSDCDALLEKGEAIPATDHDWGEWTTVSPAKCEVDGLEKRVCKNDSSHVEENVLPAIEHKWDNGVIDPVSTCKTHGVKTYICQNDALHKKTEQVELDKNNHVGETYIKDDKAATCTEDGYTGDTYCSDCDALLEKGEAIPATDHDWGEWTTVTPATCEVDGLEKRVCKNDSSHVEENVLPAIEHKWDDGVIDPVSTCKTHGVKTYTCQNDASHKKTEQVALDENNHVGETYIKDDKAATCTEDGYTGDTYCSDCDALLEKGEAIPATDHDWGEWTTVTPAKCEVDGLEKRVCKNDANHVEENVLPATDHDWGEWETVTPATCEEDGLEKRVCKNDSSHVEENVLPATDHDWGEWTTVTPAKCEADGLEKRVCKNDSNHVEENVLPAIEHDYHKIADKSKAPDYGVAGYDYYECSYDASHNYTVEVASLVKTTFTAKFITTAPFFKEDKVVAEVTFVQGDKFVEEPAVDKYDNYTFAWDEYELKDEDIVIYGRYTEIEINDITTPEAEKKAEINNGVATITLEAKANSKNIKILSEKTKPVDVVLVLDQSGSMAEILSTNGKTKRDALVECANDFVKELYDNAVATGAQHRVAVVGFSYSDYNGGNYKNTGILATANGKSINYKSLKDADYASALMSVATADGINANITKGINSVVADGATSAHLGLEMANNIFAMTNKESGRERIVLFITDGTPTSWGEETDLVKTTAAKAITEANELKNAQGAKVYSIGVHANANPTAGFTSDDYGVATDNRGSFKSYDFNRFLHAVSSNYPTAGSIRVSEMGEGSKNSGYYLGVQDTSKLSEIFSKILLSSVYEVKTFDKVTIVDTVSKEFTLTLEQETEMRERLISELGIRNEEITVTRNEDGTTTLRFDNVRTQKEYNDDGSSYYSAKLSFDISADEDSLGLTEVNTNTEDAGIEYDGETLEKFDVPTVVLEPDRKLIVFTVNGTVYRIEEAKLGDNVVAPESSLAQWNIPEGTVVEGDYVVFEASTVESKEYTVIWVSENSKVTETYSFGELINIPDAAEKTDYDFLKWSPEVPATMPNYNITFTAAYTPKHSHTYNKAYTYGKCTEGITTVYECACGDSYEEKADITKHNAKAIVEQTNNGTLIEKVTCQVCGTTNSQELTYKVTYREGWRNTVLDLTLLENDVSVQPDGTLEIRFYVGENVNKNYTVYRIDENGNRTTYTPRKENGYLIFDADHFSFYVVAELDEETGEVADDTSYEEVYCVSNGHSYEGIVTGPTCTEKGYTTYTCSVCKDSYVADEVSALGHKEVTVKGHAATCTDTGLTDGVKCSVCNTVLTAQRTIAKISHKDENGDYKCDYYCGYDFEQEPDVDTPDDPSEKCSHICHNTGFMGFIWKILRFFFKLFGSNKICSCGAAHY